MEETLKTLSDYQIQALRKGISCDINIEFNNQKVPTAEIRMRYSITGGISKGYTFVTTFSDNLCKSKTEERLHSVEHFITTVTE
jgi:hypothetical protein